MSHDTRQPYLFDLVSCVKAPSVVLSAPDGQILEGGVQGWLRADRRLVSRLHLTLNGQVPVGLSHELRAAGGAVFRGVVPQGAPAVADQQGPDVEHDDPTLVVERTREVAPDDFRERITVTSTATRRVSVELTVTAAADLSSMAEVRAGRPRDPVVPVVDGRALTWAGDQESVRFAGDPAPDRTDPDRGLRWTFELTPGESRTVLLRAAVQSARRTLFAACDRPPWEPPRVTSPDHRVAELVAQGLHDLAGLLLVDPGPDGHAKDGDAFAAAGSPWFLTLFGRDSLWTARMMLPLGTGLAMSTLRALARRQGTREDPTTEEQPGRILHEARPEALVLANVTLPPTYYGTSDATQLFVTCCADSWRWGADEREVRELVPAVERALAWMEAQAGDGFIKYVDATGRGLANHGWKDSVDSIQWADGRLADGPIALSEVQAYAYQAALAGADLLEAFGRPDAQHWREWAAALADRFRRAFWVEDDDGRYPAVALDRDGRAVDSVASNMGHLLGTGLLERHEAALVARRLSGPAMSSGFGLRTLTAASPRYSRLSYHGGAVWPHDTVIAIAGLAREGFGEEAATLFRGLVHAAPDFDFRLPELWGGDSADDAARPMPYPAACRPQAWAAAAPLAGLVALLGLEVDVPGGRVSGKSVLPSWLLPFSVSGLRVGAHRLDLTIDADGGVRVETDHPGLSEVSSR